MKQALIIFAKNPIAGKVKTRLAATIGNENALSVYRQLLLHTAEIASQLAVDKYVFYSDHIQQEDVWDNQLFSKETQRGNDLGERMMQAFASLFDNGYNRIVIIGTDCPELSTEIIIDAFQLLEVYDFAIGPAHDGGYYLLGMKQFQASLFENINWSTHTVLAETRVKCEALQMDYTLLSTLRDIDREEDLKYFKNQYHDQHHHPDIQ